MKWSQSNYYVHGIVFHWFIAIHGSICLIMEHELFVRYRAVKSVVNGAFGVDVQHSEGLGQYIAGN